MSDAAQTRPVADAAPVSDEAVNSSDPGDAQPRRCVQCGGPFGLVRRRRAGRQFCSAACMDKHAESVRQAVRDKARWYEFLTQRG